MKLFDCLPQQIVNVLRNYDNVTEIRLRNNRPARVNVGGVWYWLGTDKLTNSYSGAVVFPSICNQIIATACNNSTYAYENQLYNGYFTLQDGARIGICGKVANSGVFAQYDSLCVRVPHCVSCCNNLLLDAVAFGNTIVIGTPASGKTTLLRNIAQEMSVSKNVLVVDERNELFFDGCNKANCDVISCCDKQYAFNVGVRSMSPDLVVFDEITPSDGKDLANVLNCGVNVVCSVHGNSIGDFTKKYDFSRMFNNAVLLKGKYSYTVSHLENNLDD